MTAPGGSLDAEFIDPAFTTTPCPECGTAVAFTDLPDHLARVHGLEPADT